MFIKRKYFETHLSNFRGNFDRPVGSLLDNVLNGTFSQILIQLQITETLLSASVKRKLSIPSTSTNERIIKHAKSKNFSKSRGRYFGYSDEESVTIESREHIRKFNLESLWKIDMKKCIDSSPLLIVKGNILILLHIASSCIIRGL